MTNRPGEMFEIYHFNKCLWQRPCHYTKVVNGEADTQPFMHSLFIWHIVPHFSWWVHHIGPMFKHTYISYRSRKESHDTSYLQSWFTNATAAILVPSSVPGVWTRAAEAAALYGVQYGAGHTMFHWVEGGLWVLKKSCAGVKRSQVQINYCNYGLCVLYGVAGFNVEPNYEKVVTGKFFCVC